MNPFLFLTSAAAILNGASAFVPTAMQSRGSASVILHMSDAYSSYLSVDEQSPRNIAPFDEWTTTCGVQRSEGLRMFMTNPDDEYNQDDVSLTTDVDLPAGSPVLGVPANMMLTSTNSQAELEAISDSLNPEMPNSDAGGVRKAVDMLSRLGAGDTVPKFYLFLKVLLEYSKGSESPYYPWLDSMPRLFYNSVSMTNFCYECLPPLVFSLSRRERVKFDNFYDALQQIDPQILPEEIKTDKDTIVKWAFNVVHTRAFSGERSGQSGDGNGVGEGGVSGEEQRIVPMADMVCFIFDSVQLSAAMVPKFLYPRHLVLHDLISTFSFRDFIFSIQSASLHDKLIRQIEPSIYNFPVNGGVDVLIFHFFRPSRR